MADMTDVEKQAREHLAKMDKELQEMREAYRAEIKRSCERHELILRDIDEKFYEMKEPLEKHRDALLQNLVDLQASKNPFLILLN